MSGLLVACRALGDLVDPASRPPRDERMVAMAITVGKVNADCLRRRVGAVIYDDEGRVIGVGYNGRAPGLPGCASAGACPRGQQSYAQVPGGAQGGSYAPGTAGACDALHAELNASVDGGRFRCKGCTIAISDEPCYMCRTVIRAAGLVRAVWPVWSEDGLDAQLGEWIVDATDLAPVDPAIPAVVVPEVCRA